MFMGAQTKRRLVHFPLFMKNSNVMMQYLFIFVSGYLHKALKCK